MTLRADRIQPLVHKPIVPMPGTSFSPNRADFVALSARAPGLAGELAYRRFCTPILSERRSSDHRILADRARFHLRRADWIRLPTTAGEVQLYVYEPDQAPARGTVIVVHGWTSEASFMTALAEPIRRAGWRTVLFDCPAHGLSAGRRTNLVDCARATLAVAEAFQPVHAFVTHSFGSLVALLVAEGGPPMPRRVVPDRFVMVAAPNRMRDVTAHFGRHIGLGTAAQRVYEHHLERIGHRPLDGFRSDRLLRATGRPALLLHAPDDHEVPIRNAEAIAAANPQADLLAFDGLGHRKILYAPPPIRAAVAFLGRDA